MVPAYLATSPILSDGGSLMVGASSLGCVGGDSGMGSMKKRRKRRRKSKVDSMKREGSADYSEDEDMFTIEMSSNEGEEQDNGRCVFECLCFGVCVYGGVYF